MALEPPPTAFVWVWLPGTTEPVVAGRLDDDGRLTAFTYGRSYLSRADAIPLYEPELPLRSGPQLPELMPIHGCIADAGPDAWGRRVIERRRQVGLADTAGAAANLDLSDLDYLLEAGSNRIGGLDFQASPDEYRPHGEGTVGLEDLLRAAELVEGSDSIPPALDLALLHGTSVGGAQPKAILEDGARHLIAKFGSRTDVLPVVKLEYVAMTLAQLTGLRVAPVELGRVLGKDVLLVERFDRPGDGSRRLMVSARTLLRLGEFGVGASYSELADLARSRFVEPGPTLRELFARITFNIIVGNTDDHARNHAAFWDGVELALTPAYDIVPQLRSGAEASQAMAIGPDGFRGSQLAGCVERAASYRLSGTEARAIIDHQIATVEEHWEAACDHAGLSDTDRRSFWGRQILNPFALRGY